MHELSLMQSIFTMLEEQALTHGLKQITQVELVVGQLSGADPMALQFAFQCLAQDTIADGAELLIIPIKVTGRCLQCGAFLEGISGLTCNCTGPPDYQMYTGTELYLKSVIGKTEVRGETD